MTTASWLSPMPYRRLFAWLTPQAFIASKVIGPIGQFLLFVYIVKSSGGYNSTFVIVGSAVLLTMFGGLYGITFAMLSAHRSGVARDARVSPRGLVGLYVPLALWSTVDSLITSTVVLVLGANFYNVVILNKVGFACAFVVVSATSAAFGILVAEVSLYMRDDGGSIINTIVFLTTLLSGALIASTDLPFWLQDVSRFWPFSGGLEGAREATLGRDWYSSVLHEIFSVVVLLGLGFAVHLITVTKERRGARPD